MIALTFDDGPGPTTSKILDILAEYNVLATFFVVGQNMNLKDTDYGFDGLEITKRIVREGHTIGNHTFSHSKTFQDELTFLNEVLKVDEMIRELYRQLNISYSTPPFRLPFGVQVNNYRLHYLTTINRYHVHWTQDFDDWHEGPMDSLALKIIGYVSSRESAGLNSILDLHDSGIGNENGYKRDATAQALELLLKEAKRQDWIFFRYPIKS